MRIIECYIENFGKLSAYTHKFSSGLNSTLAENGWGKTTLSVFIKSMFYGLNTERRQALDENDRKKYAPWQGGRYGGSLTFTHGGKTYRIERSFGTKAADDVFRIVDADTGANSTDFSENIGTELFDIDAAGFERTVFLSEKNLSGAISNDSISAKLSDLVGTTGDVGAVSGALARLEERRKFYQKRGNTGEISLIRARISECESAIGDLERRRESLEEKERRLAELAARIRSLDENRAALQKELAAAKAESEQAAFREQYVKMRAEIMREKAEYAELERYFALGVPTQLEIDEVRDAARDAQALRSARSDYEPPELTELRAFFGRDTDFSEIESIKQVYRAERDAAAEAGAIETKLKFAEGELASELGGRIPSVKELDDCIAAFGSHKSRGIAIMLAVAAVIFGALSFITPYFLIGAIPMAIISAVIAIISHSRTKSAYAYASSLGISADPARLSVLRERVEDHLKVKALDGERLARILEEKERHTVRLSAYLSAYPHGAPDVASAISAIEEKYRRYYSLSEVSRAGENARAGIDVKIQILMQKVDEFGKKYRTSSQDPYEEVRTKLNAYLYAKRTLAKREDDLRSFAVLHGIKDSELAGEKSAKDTSDIIYAIDELESAILTARREEALLESQYASELSEVERIEYLSAERDGYREKLNASLENLEIIRRTMEFLSEASEAMTSRYIGGTKARFEHYLELIGDGGEFAMGTDFAVKKVDRGETRVAESYSKGTRDLYSFCLRLALSDALWSGELPFVMLDDPFASLDSNRLERAKALISNLAREKQVIYFTCSKERMI